MITEKQKEQRRQSIGSSDAACVLGLDPYRNLYDLWLEKTGRVEGFSGNKATERGDYLEDGILRWAADRLGEKVVKPSNSFTLGRLRAHVDGQVGKYGRGNPIVEAKNMVQEGDWGREMTDEVPEHVFIQVQHQMVCAEAPHAYVARLSGGMGMSFSMYRVDPDPEIQRAIIEQSEAFWSMHIETDEPPPYEKASEGMIQYMQRIQRDGSSTRISDEHMKAYHHWKQVEADAQGRMRYHKARIMEDLGEHSKGEGQMFRVNMVQVSPSMKLDTKALKEAMPEVYEKFCRESSGYSYPRVSQIKRKETS